MNPKEPAPSRRRRAARADVPSPSSSSSSSSSSIAASSRSRLRPARLTPSPGRIVTTSGRHRPSTPGDRHCATKTSAASVHAAACEAERAKSGGALPPLPPPPAPPLGPASASAAREGTARSIVAARSSTAPGTARTAPRARRRRACVVAADLRRSSAARPPLSPPPPPPIGRRSSPRRYPPPFAARFAPSPFSAFATIGAVSRYSRASEVAGERSSPPLARHAFSAVRSVAGSFAARSVSASPRRASPRKETTSGRAPAGERSCGHDLRSCRSVCAHRLASSL